MTTSKRIMPPIRHILILQMVNRVYDYAVCCLLHVLKPHSLSDPVCSTAKALGRHGEVVGLVL